MNSTVLSTHKIAKTYETNFRWILFGIWICGALYFVSQNVKFEAAFVFLLLFGAVLFFINLANNFLNPSTIYITKNSITDNSFLKKIHMNLGDVIINEVRVMDIDRFEHPEMAFNFPSGHIGNMEISWNMNSGHCFKRLVTDYRNVIYIPTTKKQHYLLSIENPQEFIAALKEAHANS